MATGYNDFLLIITEHNCSFNFILFIFFFCLADMGACVFSPNSERALDLQHALSLLSNDSCSPADPLQISGIKFIGANHTSIVDPMIDMVDSTPGMLQDQQPLAQPHGSSLSDTLKLHMLDHCIDFDSEVSFPSRLLVYGTSNLVNRVQVLCLDLSFFVTGFISTLDL